MTTFLRALPTGVVDTAGRPGSAALGSGEVPGAADVTVTSGEPYSVWAVTVGGDEPFDVDDVTVACDGGTGPTVSFPAVSGSSGAGTYTARTVAQLIAPADGTCTVAVAAGPGSSAGPGGSTFVVTEGWRFGELVATVGGTILLWFVAIGGGVVGLGLLVGGIVWRYVSRRV
ncbi:hypothetical protein IF650_15585 [Cellulosimicrobium terreum]|nr:hypothetical protein [Cellulosimicrobium terreum]